MLKWDRDRQRKSDSAVLRYWNRFMGADNIDDPKLAEMALVRQSRLSVMPVSKPHWDHICRLGGWKG